MTDFYAIYLFIFLAIVLLGLGLWSKYSWLFGLAALAWGITGIYSLVTGYAATPDRTYVIVFGLFALCACVACSLAPMIVNKKPESPPKPSYREYLNTEVDKYKRPKSSIW